MSKIKYRDHRGSLEESMKTEREFESFEDLLKDLEETHGKIEKLSIEMAGYDARTKWDTFYVKGEFHPDQGMVVLGMTNGNF